MESRLFCPWSWNEVFQREINLSRWFHLNVHWHSPRMPLSNWKGALEYKHSNDTRWNTLLTVLWVPTILTYLKKMFLSLEKFTDPISWLNMAGHHFFFFFFFLADFKRNEQLTSQLWLETEGTAKTDTRSECDQSLWPSLDHPSILRCRMSMTYQRKGNESEICASLRHSCKHDSLSPASQKKLLFTSCLYPRAGLWWCSQCRR